MSRIMNLYCRHALFLLVLAIAFSELSFAQAPQINSVQFSGSPGNYTLTISGSNLGSPTVTLPFTGDVSNFRIGDSATLHEWGYIGDADTLTYNSWSNTMVAVSGFGGQPGDAVTVALWNSSSQKAATWGGNVPPANSSTPQIASVELSSSGRNLQVVVNGSGFGTARSSLPPVGTAGNINYFRFLDFRAHCGSGSSLFEAGFQGWGVDSPDAVTLFYESWSDNQIVISGFGGAYGKGCATYQAGDPIAIVVYASTDTTLGEAETAWGGPAQAHIAISVKDLTTGKQIPPGAKIVAGDEFQVTVTTAPEFNCAGQFVVTALGAPTAPPSVIVQTQTFILGPAVGSNSIMGGVLTSNGTPGHENDWKISASCNGASTSTFASATFEFLSAVP